MKRRLAISAVMGALWINGAATAAALADGKTVTGVLCGLLVLPLLVSFPSWIKAWGELREARGAADAARQSFRAHVMKAKAQERAS